MRRAVVYALSSFTGTASLLCAVVIFCSAASPDASAALPVYLFPRTECRYASCAQGGFEVQTYAPTRLVLPTSTSVPVGGLSATNITWTGWGSARAVGVGVASDGYGDNYTVRFVASDRFINESEVRKCPRGAISPTRYYKRLYMTVEQPHVQLGSNQAAGPTIQC